MLVEPPSPATAAEFLAVHYPFMRKCAARTLRDDQDIEDACQEAALKATRYWDNPRYFDPQRGGQRTTWLWAIVHQEAINVGRLCQRAGQVRERAGTALLDATVSPPPPDLEAPVGAHDALARLLAIRSL